jgi:hypothetical protein
MAMLKRLTVALPYAGEDEVDILSESLVTHPLVDCLLCLSQADLSMRHEAIRIIKLEEFFSAAAIGDLLAHWRSDYLLIVLPGGRIELGARALERLIQVADDSGSGMIYSDFSEKRGAETTDHPLIEYQIGSIRDNFDFGSLLLISRKAADRALEKWGDLPHDVRWGGLYDLRLKISIDSEIVRIPEPLYIKTAIDRRAGGESIFDYVDPRNRDYQLEMEKLSTEHLKRIGAWLEPVFAEAPESRDKFPVKASVIIPVRNRARTITDAVASALTQTTDFNFNVLVVDNHSSDGTTDLLRELAAESKRLIHIIPARTDFGIGGCWNEAIYSQYCGRYAVQLDSDDIYRDDKTLGRVVAELEKGRYAMVIGSYTIVDFDLNELPPGLVDHREWTRDNGRNNALRINGLGAPRAFDVNVLRKIGLPNVSYGEDYAVALRVSREYEIGRIYDSLYYARRWSGNSDSALPLGTMNRYDTYKDRLRTIEIQARQQLNANKKGQNR